MSNSTAEADAVRRSGRSGDLLGWWRTDVFYLSGETTVGENPPPGIAGWVLLAAWS